ncbi:ABC transporter substrate-binding protein [Marispirochaeta aestuarii]|uniref:ABC transporter substrate-binding protein n=1 Tax=Marispirochaeta aestuarii TaxID=1963862 RepID=A0A1Y1S124_9SPIO|nr:extracellular solute-binding protein [Marispirochaeta aestuarii]ORC36990.1 ABC transporter substrate-binding protein [Marispirochaeta aestuarii]
MKKALFLLLSLSLVATSLFAAGGQEQKEEGPIELEFWTHEDPNRTAIEERYIQEFEAENPGITVKRVTHSSTKIQELVLTAFAANQGPDIFNMSIEDEYAYIANGRVAAVDARAVGYKSIDELKNAYIPKVLDPVVMDGKLYGLPLELTNWSIYINKRVFRDAGLDPETDYPRTWEEMADISEKIIIRDGDIITRRGFDFRYPYYLVSMVPMVEQLGGELISKDGKTAIVGEEAWISFLDYMKAWGPNGRNLGSPTYKNARKLFNYDNNDIAMALTGLYQQGRIKADNEDFYNSGEWMVVPFPQFEDAKQKAAACYYGHYYMVNGQTSERRQQAAWKFIGYMLSHGEEYLTTVNIIQPTKKLMESDTFKNMPYSDVFRDDMENGHIVYYGENSAKMQELIKQAVESVMLSGVSSEKAYATLKAEAQELLDEE